MTYSNLTKLISTKASFALLGLLFIFNMPGAIAADSPGSLASEPLQTSATAEPNIMFLIDDSGSMDAAISATNSDNRWTTLLTTMDALLGTLDGVYVGFSSFKGNGSIAQELTLLDKSATGYTTTLATMNTNIAALGGTLAAGYPSLGGVGTKLSDTMQDIGRYFANGNAGGCAGDGSTTDNDLVIHPTQNLPGDTPAGLKATIECSDLLGNKATIISKAEAIPFSCQKSFAIVMSDGAASDDYAMRSDTYTYSTSTSNHPFADYDEDCTTAAKATGPYTCGDIDQKDGGTKDYTYGSDGSDYLDDVAQAFYEIDLRPDYTDFKNNITTYAVGFGADLLDPDTSPYNPLLESAAEQAGGNYYFADDAASLLSSFENAISSIVAQTSTSSAVTFNSSTLSSQSAVYQALFNTSSWSGELNSFPIDGFTGDILISTCTDAVAQAGTLANCWQAAYQLDEQTKDDTGVAARFMVTYGDNNTGVEFKYIDGTDDYTSLSSATDVPQAFINDICADSSMPFACNDSTTADVSVGGMKDLNSKYIRDMVNYLRGDKAEEGGNSTRKFRGRVHALGDIVNSSPVFVGAPQQNWPSTGVFPPSDPTPSLDESYFTWKKSTVKDRDEIVYVASNDGILHGFQTKETFVSGTGQKDAGNEVFAYVPTGTFNPVTNKGLHFIADKDYTHRFYNDLSPTIADVYMNYRTTSGGITGSPTTPAKTSSTAAWRTVLLGGQGGGGKSLYLLDITDPDKYVSASADEVVLWEFSDATNLGYTFSKPTIAMMNDGRFAAIFGNGYNSTSCTAQLFIVFLEGGLDGDWVIADGDYLVFDTGYGAPAGNCNGLSTPAVVDLNGDGTADRVYAGDLKGNMWAFDLCNLTSGVCATSGWGIADANPMMVADDGTNRQPITVKPIVSRDPATVGFDDLIIVFGTGQYLVDADKSSTSQQTVYGMRDYDALSNTKAVWNKDPRTNPDKFSVNSFDFDSTSGARTIKTPESTMASGDTGWLIDLGSDPTNPGERVVVNPKVRNNILFFNTIIPNDTKCSYGGSGWLMSVSLESGGSPPDAVFDLDGDGTIGDSDDFISGSIPVGISVGEIPAESTFLGDNQYTPGSDGTINKRKVNIGETRSEGRMSWKEVYEEQ